MSLSLPAVESAPDDDIPPFETEGDICSYRSWLQGKEPLTTQLLHVNVVLTAEATPALHTLFKRIGKY
jgi:hypothetical protein